MQGSIELILNCNSYASLMCQVLSTGVYLLNTQEYLLGDRCCMQGQDWHLFWQRPFFHQLVSSRNQSKSYIPPTGASIHSSHMTRETASTTPQASSALSAASSSSWRSGRFWSWMRTWNATSRRWRDSTLGWWRSLMVQSAPCGYVQIYFT